MSYFKEIIDIIEENKTKINNTRDVKVLLGVENVANSFEYLEDLVVLKTVNLKSNDQAINFVYGKDTLDKEESITIIELINENAISKKPIRINVKKANNLEVHSIKCSKNNYFTYKYDTKSETIITCDDKEINIDLSETFNIDENELESFNLLDEDIVFNYDFSIPLNSFIIKTQNLDLKYILPYENEVKDIIIKNIKFIQNNEKYNVIINKDEDNEYLIKNISLNSISDLDYELVQKQTFESVKTESQFIDMLVSKSNVESFDEMEDYINEYDTLPIDINKDTGHIIFSILFHISEYYKEAKNKVENRISKVKKEITVKPKKELRFRKEILNTYSKIIRRKGSYRKVGKKNKKVIFVQSYICPNSLKKEVGESFYKLIEDFLTIEVNGLTKIKPKSVKNNKVVENLIYMILKSLLFKRGKDGCIQSLITKIENSYDLTDLVNHKLFTSFSKTILDFKIIDTVKADLINMLKLYIDSKETINVKDLNEEKSNYKKFDFSLNTSTEEIFIDYKLNYGRSFLNSNFEQVFDISNINITKLLRNNKMIELGKDINKYLMNETNLISILDNLSQKKEDLIDYDFTVIIENEIIELKEDLKEKLTKQLKNLSNLDYLNIDFFNLIHNSTKSKNYNKIVQVFLNNFDKTTNMKNRYYSIIKELVSNRFEHFETMKNKDYLTSVFKNLFNTKENKSYLVGNKEIKEYLNLKELDMISEHLDIQISNICVKNSSVDFDMTITYKSTPFFVLTNNHIKQKNGVMSGNLSIDFGATDNLFFDKSLLGL